MNFLPEEAAIIERLKQKVAVDAALLTALGVSSIKVGSIKSILGIAEIGGLLPGVFLMPGASEVVDSSNDNRAGLEDVMWETIVVMAVTPDPANLLADYSKEGLLIGAVAEALVGWKPLPGYRAIRYAGRGDPQPTSRHTEFPVRFMARRGFAFSGE